MPRVSKRKPNKKAEEELVYNFIQIISKINNEKVARNFLNDLFTKEEKIMLSKRLMLFALLRKNYSPSTINSILSISYETIRIHSNQLPFKSSDFIKVLDVIIKTKDMEEFWKKVDRLLKPIDLFLQSKTNMKARSKLLFGDLD